METRKSINDVKDNQEIDQGDEIHGKVGNSSRITTIHTSNTNVVNGYGDNQNLPGSQYLNVNKDLSEIGKMYSSAKPTAARKNISSAIMFGLFHSSEQKRSESGLEPVIMGSDMMIRTSPRRYNSNSS